MMTDSLFCLRWNNFQRNIISEFGSLWADEDFVDVTLSCGGNSVQAHKVVLSAYSIYFKDLLKKNPCQHPIIILQDVAFDQLQKLVEFMYNGQVNISQDSLRDFLKTAKVLKIRGLAEEKEGYKNPLSPDASASPYFLQDSKTEDSSVDKVLYPHSDDSYHTSGGNSNHETEVRETSPSSDMPVEKLNPSSALKNFTPIAPKVALDTESNEFHDNDLSFNYAETKLEVDEDNILSMPSDLKNIPSVMEVDNSYILSGVAGERIPSRKLPENSVQCLYCPKLVTRQHMKRHVRDIHSPNLERVTCHLCGKKYKNTNSLTAHHYYAHRKQPDKDVSVPVISQVYESADFDLPNVS